MTTTAEHELFRRFGPGWWKRLARTFLWGMGIYGLILLLGQFGFFSAMRDHFRDQLMRIDLTLPHDVQVPRGFIFVAIDDQAYRDWGSPAMLPRDRLADLLHVSLISNPALVILDVDLGRSQPEHDEDLQALFEQLDAQADDGEPGPHIILVRRLERPPGQMDGPFVLPESRYDDIVARSPRLHWAVHGLSVAADGLVRRVRHWEPVCYQDRPMLLPSAALLAAYSITNGDNTLNADGLAHELATLGLPDCASGQMPDGGHATVWIGEHRVDLDAAEPGQAIVFSLPATLSTDQNYPVNRRGDEEYYVLTMLDAQMLGDPRVIDTGTPLLSNRIVIIGGTYADGRDSWLTPIGSMPGALVLINSIFSLWQHGTVPELSIVYRVLIMAGICIVIFLFLEIFRAQGGYEIFDVIFGLITTAALYLIGYFLLKFGAWMEFLLPMWVIQFAYYGMKSRELRDALNQLSAEKTQTRRSSRTTSGKRK